MPHLINDGIALARAISVALLGAGSLGITSTMAAEPTNKREI